MDSVVFSEQNILTIEPELASVGPLLERGILCIQQGYAIEGATLLALARDQLLPSQVQLVAVLDALNRAIALHAHAQQELHKASKRFAESDSEQQAQIVALQKLLPTFVVARDATLQTQKSSTRKQGLRLLPSAEHRDENAKAYSAPLCEDRNLLPALSITCFGHFEVRRFHPFDQSMKPVNLCQNLKGQAILRYLIAQPKHQATMDMLTTVFWPEDTAVAAYHKLRIAVSALRCSLNKDFVQEVGGGYILCRRQSAYELNPSVALKSDVDEFLAFYQAGLHMSDNSATMAHYEKACTLYTGPFLVEDVYEDWSSMQREELIKTYVEMCGKLAEFNIENGCYEATVKWATAILKVDRCDEEAHCLLIRAYAAQGRRNDVLRQYQQCQRVLSEEMGVQPLPETQKLFQTLLL